MNRQECILQKGFTLIEVMVALAVAGVALVAVTFSMGSYARNIQILQEKSYAHWVAINRFTELQLAEKWPATGSRDGEDKSILYPMYWTREISETPFGRIRKVEISIYRNKKDKDEMTTLTGYVGKGSQW